MCENRISIEIESGKYDFIIRSGEVSKVKIVLPMFASITSDFKLNENGIYNLRINEDVDKYRSGKENIKYCFSLNPISKKISIVVPNDYITNLDVVIQNGNLLLKDLILDKNKINNIKGKITITDSHSEFTDINGVMGNIKLIRVNGIEASLYTRIGRVNIIDSDFDRFVCETETGNISVKFLNNQLNDIKVYVGDRQVLSQNNIKNKKLGRVYSFITGQGKIRSNIF